MATLKKLNYAVGSEDSLAADRADYVGSRFGDEMEQPGVAAWLECVQASADSRQNHEYRLPGMCFKSRSRMV